jgi:fatty acid/phospholipid biosynthesis enzyme
MRRFEVLLQSIVADADTTVDVLNIYSESEKGLQEDQLKASRRMLRTKKASSMKRSGVLADE